MSAADSTSKGQFGWIEQTSQTVGEGLNTGSARLRYVDRASINPNHTQPQADVHATVSANWHRESPRAYSEDEIRFEEDADPRDEALNRQGRLVTEGQDHVTLSNLASTRQGRFASARGVGIMANLVEGYTGKTPSPSKNLSAQSAPLVSKLTGEEHRQSNSITFQDQPETGLVPDVSRPERTSRPIEQLHHTDTFRFLPEGEAKAGGQRLKSHMAAMRIPREGVMPKGMKPTPPGEQLELVPEPHGHRGTTTFESHQQNLQNRNWSSEAARTMRRHEGERG